MTSRTLNRLTAMQAAKLKTPGKHADGGGLYLLVDGSRRSWIFRYTWRERERSLGLGSARDLSLAKAREMAAE
ncbi:Arm DNA-binding domain-containing protein [Novosphingobium sp. G106]|uniref:Arm DNA-binding domain-containing protein n=1 Tax=Novosphingobium sp. G106 TaxID=2849500 RepID=UPI001C2D59B1|nr:Arm DNA-binding domain-containing protein [Novosphingobium sp. G106]MBV1692404.1 Arm DNA-binding domain-containing protein [Novosphingobium sp. G106]